MDGTSSRGSAGCKGSSIDDGNAPLTLLLTLVCSDICSTTHRSNGQLVLSQSAASFVTATAYADEHITGSPVCILHLQLGQLTTLSCAILKAPIDGRVDGSVCPNHM